MVSNIIDNFVPSRSHPFFVFIPPDESQSDEQSEDDTDDEVRR